MLGPLEPAADERGLDPERYGVVVADAAGRRGVLLPAIPGVDTVARQLDIARRKAGIPAREPVRVWRFTVEKFEEP